MPRIVDQGVVVRVWDWSETSQTVALFCRERGMVRGLAKGAKRARSAFCGGFEPLTRGEVVAIIKPSSELATLTEWDLQEVFWGPRRSLGAHYAGLYFADLVAHALTDSDPHPTLWDALVAALRGLENPAAQSEAALRLQWATIVETGYKPHLDGPGAPASESTSAVGFDPAAGRLTPDPGPGVRVQGPWRVRPETIELLRTIEHNDGGESLRAGPDDRRYETIRRANRLLATYLRWLLGRELPTLRAALAHVAGRTPPKRAEDGRERPRRT